MPDGITCATCPFWDGYGLKINDTAPCRVDPPRNGGWPRTAAFDWCGAHPMMNMVTVEGPAEESPTPNIRTMDDVGAGPRTADDTGAGPRTADDTGAGPRTMDGEG